MLTLLCALVDPVPVGTHLGLLHLLWMLVSGRLVEARGAVIPGLSACGLPERAVRRVWAALLAGRRGDRSAAGAVADAGASGRAVAAAHLRGLSSCGRGRDRVLAASGADLRDDALACRGRQSTAGHPGGPDRAGRGGGGWPAPGSAAGRRARRHSGPQRQHAPAPPGPGCRGPLCARQCAGAGRGLQCGVAAPRRGPPVTWCAWPRTARSAAPARRPLRAAAARPGAERWCVRCPAPTRDRASRLPRPIGWRPGPRRMSCSARRSGTTWRCPMRWRTAPPSPWSPSTLRAEHDPLLLGSSLPLSAPALRAFSADRWPVEQLPLAAKQMRERRPRVRSCSPDLPAPA